jgi:hypothetical protein
LILYEIGVIITKRVEKNAALENQNNLNS